MARAAQRKDYRGRRPGLSAPLHLLRKGMPVATGPAAVVPGVRSAVGLDRPRELPALCVALSRIGFRGRTLPELPGKEVTVRRGASNWPLRWAPAEGRSPDQACAIRGARCRTGPAVGSAAPCAAFSRVGPDRGAGAHVLAAADVARGECCRDSGAVGCAPAWAAAGDLARLPAVAAETKYAQNRRAAEKRPRRVSRLVAVQRPRGPRPAD